MGRLDELRMILAEVDQLGASTVETVDLVGRLIRERDESRAGCDPLAADLAVCGEAARELTELRRLAADEIERLRAGVGRLKAQP